MREISQSQILERYVCVTKEKRKHSNCQFMMSDIEEKLRAGVLYAYEVQGVFLLVENKEDLFCLYYMSEVLDWIKELTVLKERFPRLVISVVQKKTRDSEVLFEEHGYSLYKKYERLRCKGNLIEDIEADYCNEQDKSILQNMMNDTFDVYSDHIPTSDELDLFISNQQIICVRDEDKEICGFVIFEDKGKTSYIRMVCVSKDHQGEGLANCLMKMYFGIHQKHVSFTLWYDMENGRAASLYKKWNYEAEGLYNLIYVI